MPNNQLPVNTSPNLSQTYAQNALGVGANGQPQYSPTQLMPGQSSLDSGVTSNLDNQLGKYVSNGQMSDPDRQFVDSGVSGTSGLVPGASQISSGPINSSMTMPGLSDALAERANQKYSGNIAAARNLSNVESPYQESQRLAQLGGQYNAEQNLALTNYKQQLSSYLQENQAYNSWLQAKNNAGSAVLNSILGGIGAVGGAIAGTAIGGPAGGIAGAAAGSKL